MIFGVEKKLDDKVIELLLNSPGLEASVLHETLAQKGTVCTIQALYYELRKLERSSIIYRLDKRYYLRALWLRAVHAKAKACLEKPSRFPLIKPGKSSATWKLKSLRSLHLWWSNVTTTLFSEPEVGEYYEWVPHAWFHRSSFGIEELVLNSHVAASVPYFLAIGGDSAVDEEYARLRTNVPGSTCMASYSPPALRHTYLSVLGPYVITIQMEPALSEQIHSLFAGAREPDQWDSKAFLALSEVRSPIKFALSKNPQKANAMRSELQAMMR